MAAPMLMTDCPTEETLAAYVDDRLDAATRLKVTEHLASCGDCRGLVMMATDYQASETPPNVVRGWFGARNGLAAAGLAAAAVIAIFVLRPSFVFGPDMEDLIAAAEGSKSRLSAGRMAGGFPYKEMPQVTRGFGDKPEYGDLQILNIAVKAKDPHVKSAAMLLAATNRDEYENGITELRKAHKNARDEERDAIEIDLAAALLGRWSSDENHQESLRLSNELLKRKQQSTDAMWNRAAALELLGRDAEAIKAWDNYLNLDSDSEWAAEAARRKEKLTTPY